MDSCDIIYFRKIYGNLSDALKGDECQVFYTQKVDEIIPNIRYCNYNLGDESARKDLVDLKLKSATGSALAENIDVFQNFIFKIVFFGK